MRADNGEQELVLTPDQAYLTDPATTYPVTLQSVFSITPTADADVWNVLPDDPNSEGAHLKAGTETDGSTSRAYLKFDMSPLAGQQISDVTLSLLNIDGPSCGTAVGAGIQVRRVTSAWSPSTVTWNNQPTNTTEDAVTNTSSVGGTCSPAPMTWNITSLARRWADDAGNYGVVLMSPSERASANYRVFPSSEDSDFNTPPKITATFAAGRTPTVVSPAGSDGVEVFTAPETWGMDSLPTAEAQAHALSSAQDRVEAHPDDLAPPYLDMVSGQVLVPAATAEGRTIGSQTLAGTAFLSNGLTDWTAPGEYTGDDTDEDWEGPADTTENYSFLPQSPDKPYSVNRLEAISEEVLTLSAEQLPGADALMGTRVWPERNQVIIQASAVTPELRLALAQRYGTQAVSIWLRHNAPRPKPDALAVDSRQSDTGHVNGGSRFTSNGLGCTTGFAWGNSTENYMITAGHCMPRNGNGISSIGILTGTAPNLDSTWADGKGSQKLPGQPTYYGDTARLQILPRDRTASIFVGDANSEAKRPVGGRWTRRAIVGDAYCVGGATTGQTCNWKVSDLGWKLETDDGAITRWVHRGTRANRCTFSGDSGAPVFTIRSDGYVMAKGIHHGGVHNPDNTQKQTDCVEFFTDIWDVNKAFGDRIAKRK
ncbi:hypothetical protein GCM10022224_031230 [Nonomuraea antimicrobica]|uniref:Carbohydrate-binding module family 96 domain-containing protein n=1 Tax=Nonomuraea antimicrobica TaxID=561173 RepID=A0ABP7BM67_9ACTN